MQSGLEYLFAAYTALWVVNFAYLMFLGKRYGDVKREVEQLERMVKE